MREGIHLVEVAGGDMPQRAARMIGELEVGNRFYADALRMRVLVLVAVVEHFAQMPDVVDSDAVVVARPFLDPG